jgi:hypothetical protein
MWRQSDNFRVAANEMIAHKRSTHRLLKAVEFGRHIGKHAWRQVDGEIHARLEPVLAKCLSFLKKGRQARHDSARAGNPAGAPPDSTQMNDRKTDAGLFRAGRDSSTIGPK